LPSLKMQDWYFKFARAGIIGIFLPFLLSHFTTDPQRFPIYLKLNAIIIKTWLLTT